MTRVNIDKQETESSIVKALKFTIVVAVIGVLLCIVFLALER
ncbi:hypothetical protein [uncultured Maribacter sp.]